MKPSDLYGILPESDFQWSANSVKIGNTKAL